MLSARGTGLGDAAWSSKCPNPRHVSSSSHKCPSPLFPTPSPTSKRRHTRVCALIRGPAPHSLPQPCLPVSSARTRACDGAQLETWTDRDYGDRPGLLRAAPRVNLDWHPTRMIANVRCCQSVLDWHPRRIMANVRCYVYDAMCNVGMLHVSLPSKKNHRQRTMLPSHVA